MTKTRLGLLIAPLLASTAFTAGAWAQTRPHNVILFIADGLRPGLISPTLTPAMADLQARGVKLTNTHSMFPTFTTANAASLASGHKVGDTGDFSNTIYAGFRTTAAADSITPFIENDPVLGEVDQKIGGDYMNQMTVMRAAREKGLSTATIGKLGPSLIFDHTDRTGEGTIVIDDTTGRPGGIPVAAVVQSRMTSAGLPLISPTRGENGRAGDFKTAGTTVANVEQQAFFTDVATKVVLPLFKERDRPFMMVLWSRDPDGSQHNMGDSLGRLVTGINGPTSLAAIRNADKNLGDLMAALKAQGLEETTDVILTADHGFSTISKESATSPAAKASYADVPAGLLPAGFVAMDVAQGLGMTLMDPDAKYAAVAAGAHPSKGNGAIGDDAEHPKVIVASNGGSDLIYIPDGDRELTRKVVAVLAAQDYVSGLFVDDKLGTIPGTLPISAIDLAGTAATPVPSIVVNFRTFSTGCADPVTCGVEVADTGLQQGQGMHGSFSRADTMIAGGMIGPDFRTKFEDGAPTSNADIGRTIGHILGLTIQDRGKLTGRVMMEAMPNGAMPKASVTQVVGPADDAGRQTVVQMQTVGDVRYFDAAGYPGRTLGLLSEPAAGDKTAAK